jgi:predicted DNA-binding protein with PD1-like motif
MKISSVSSSRTLRIRGAQGDALPEKLTTALQSARVAAGWLRGVGVLADVVLRATAADGSFVETRHAGPLQLVMLEGTAAAHSIETNLSALLARHTERGTETVAGAFVSAEILSFDAMLVELESASSATAAVAPAASAASAQAAGASAQPAWGEAVAASAKEPAPAARPATFASAPLPVRPVKPAAIEVDQPFPEAGDIVEHFAFGTCEVVNSDGDRIFLRVERDQRVKEIALAMLRVVPIDLATAPRLFRLERKL